jgi:hypothetical protein
MRVALYWAPSVSDPLSSVANSWLGRDAQTDLLCNQPRIPGIDDLTSDPRHYGFHCTLRPPMRLATSWGPFRDAAHRVAAMTRSFPLPRLAISTIDGFLALTLAEPSAAMQALADLCVRETEPHRQPAGADELARRRAVGLSARQEDLLQRWGYPYVMGEWLFHLTLTRRLSRAERDLVMPEAERHFAPVLAGPRSVKEICIFTQSGSDFLIAERLLLQRG